MHFGSAGKTRGKNMKKLLILCLCALPLLQACMPAALITAGAVAGGVIIYDRRSVRTMWQDRNITYQLQKRIDYNPLLHRKHHISVVTCDHIVLLVGQVPTRAMRKRAVAIANSMPSLKIKRIYNQIQIMAPSSELVRSNDAILTAKVKGAMLLQKGLHSVQIKIVTENSVVYLMGLTTRKQGALAARTARKVSGVQKVVKVFEYTLHD
jgi:osmotically-inducible protein OsmY